MKQPSDKKSTAHQSKMAKELKKLKETSLKKWIKPEGENKNDWTGSDPCYGYCDDWGF